MTLSITGMYELCEHGLRYCLDCGSAQPKEIPPENRWLEANKRLAEQRSKKKGKGGDGDAENRDNS